MSTLVSPGVSITVQDDSFYAAAGNGSVPLVVFASAQDKLVPGTTATVAAGTQKANAGKLYLMTSQRDVLQTFGTPIFQEESGTVVQGDELNEYGLHGLFSALGISNRAYALRADIDLQELQPTQVEPRGEPLNQTVWFDAVSSNLGIFEHNGGTSSNAILNWDKKNVLFPKTSDMDGSLPDITFGSAGDYAFVAFSVNDTENNLYWRNPTTDAWEAQVVISQGITPPSASGGDIWMKLDSPASGLDLKLKRYAAGYWTDLTTYVGTNVLEIEAAIDSNLSVGNYAFEAANSNIVGTFMYRDLDDQTTVEIADTSTIFDGSDFVIQYSKQGLLGVQTLTILGSDVANAAELLAEINNAGIPLKVRRNAADDGIVIFNSDKRSFTVASDDSSVSSSTNWIELTYETTYDEPSLDAEDGALWYDDSLYADIMYNQGGRWVGLNTQFGNVDVQIRQSEPTVRSDNGNLQFGDMWVDPADGTDYVFYQYQSNEVGFMMLDSTDQSTTAGVLFADARQSTETGVSYFTHGWDEARTALLASNYVEPHCPDPRLYPQGMIMVNLQQSGGVVRRATDNVFANVDFDGSNYSVGDTTNIMTLSGATDAARWVTASGVDMDGSALFGREAQRKVVVEAMGAAIVGNETLRAETIEFNILAAPGYVEMLDELVTLNVDRRETAYIVTDVPARLAPAATDINNWAQNVNNAPTNGSKGRITGYSYAAQYMGWGLGTNVDGKQVAIPGSSVALRTYLYNDAVSYVWFPPAGAERGVVTNASSVGHINVEGEYESAVYNKGQRDTMYLNKINPIAMRPNRGLLVFGDKSLSPGTSALDRVNVGRLVVYIRTEIEKIAERFLFKLNTPRVRDEFAAALTAFLANIVQLEGLNDFAVVCDTSNNTPLRIDRNELWADIAIQPTKSINFVYVPIRIQNTEG